MKPDNQMKCKNKVNENGLIETHCVECGKLLYKSPDDEKQYYCSKCGFSETGKHAEKTDGLDLNGTGNKPVEDIMDFVEPEEYLKEDAIRKAFEKDIIRSVDSECLYSNHNNSYNQDVDSFDLITDDTKAMRDLVVLILEDYDNANKSRNTQVSALEEYKAEYERVDQEKDDLRECNKILAGVNLNNAGKIAELEEKLKKAIETLEFIDEECDWEEFSGGDRRIGNVIHITLQAIKGDS